MSLGAAISDTLLDPVARGHVVDGADLAALKAGNNLLQTLPSPVHIQQVLSLVEGPVLAGESRHTLSILSLPTSGQSAAVSIGGAVLAALRTAPSFRAGAKRPFRLAAGLAPRS
jgi:hypothetical protein